MRRVMLFLTAGLAVVALAGCGGNGSPKNASALVSRTFTAAHAVRSGTLQLSLTLSPSGSATSGIPVTISLGGPFEAGGQGKAPSSDFTISLSESGAALKLGLITTPSAAYVSYGGTSYQLPASDYQQLTRSFTATGSGSGGLLGSLGIEPQQWLTHPSVAGTATIDGAKTDHITAGLDSAAFLRDLGKLLSRASAAGVPNVGGAIAGLGNGPITGSSGAAAPRVDLWTGASDAILRRVRVALSAPLPGSLSSLLGGAKRAGVVLTLGYGQLNRPQTITAPATTEPFSQFQSQIGQLLSLVEGSAGG